MDKKEVIDFLKDLIIIVIIVLIIRTFLVMPFQISWQSMYSSYYDKEFIIVDRLSYRLSEPKRGDVIVFRPNVSDDKEYFLKRIIGMSGDTIKIEKGNVYLKEESKTEYVQLDEKYLNDQNNWYTFVSWNKWSIEYIIEDWKYFVLGDNRNHSTDSRECFSNCAMDWKTNFIETRDIIWKLFIDLWYFNIKSFSFKQPYLGIDTTPKFFNSASSYDYGLVK